MTKATRRRLLVPEVVQTSGMDCGPAALASLLAGYGIRASYGRLREACQTEVDGTSIDTLEDIGAQLGLAAEQVMVPLDHLLLAETRALPAIVVVRLPIGFTHFVVVWRHRAGLVQLMDPSTGRRWQTRESFLRDVYVHRMEVPAAAWREHAGSEEFLSPLRTQLRALGADGRADALIEDAEADASFRSFASLDAALRLSSALVRGGGVARGNEATRVLEELYREARTAAGQAVIPAHYWTVREAANSAEGESQVTMTGAVLVRVRGLNGALPDADGPASRAGAPARGEELRRVLEDRPVHPLRPLWQALRQQGRFAWGMVVMALALAALGIVIEALLLRAVLELGAVLGVTDLRAGAVGALLGFLLILLALDLLLGSAWLCTGRRLETSFRVAFLEKIARLGDRYFHSRPISDMAERAHAVHALRALPVLGAEIARSLFALVLTTVGIIWLDPAGAWLALGIALSCVAVPFALHSRLTEADLRVRSHAGSLGRHTLDALLGLVAVKSHGAEAALRREHESLLSLWAQAARDRDRVAIGTDVVTTALGLGCAGWFFLSYVERTRELGAGLLLLYWALSLPAYAQSLVFALLQVPEQRNIALRLLEPLGAPEEPVGELAPTRVPPARGVAIRFDAVMVRAAGHTVLEEVACEIGPGSHVAIVGASGAGKSTLMGLLLGWHRAAAGNVWIDGEILTPERLDALRAQTAWVDPAIQIWNRSLIDNLAYGNEDGAAGTLASVLDVADLRSVLETLPEGLATPLGEGGGLVSGGEGQRIRLGRAALRRDARLVIMDEPFRGLDRQRRSELLHRARAWWQGATLLCITHDLAETVHFARVLVIDRGRVLEDGAPSELMKDPSSRYRALIDAEVRVQTRSWADSAWRRLSLRAGSFEESFEESRDGRSLPAPGQS